MKKIIPWREVLIKENYKKIMLLVPVYRDRLCNILNKHRGWVPKRELIHRSLGGCPLKPPSHDENWEGEFAEKKRHDKSAAQ